MRNKITNGVDGVKQEADGQLGNTLRVRMATLEDADAVSHILSEAFPTLYRSTFGRIAPARVPRLLAALYQAGSLSLETTRVAERSGQVVGVAILHLGKSIGRGTVASYWNILQQQLPWWLRLRALAGGVAANTMLDGRIPKAADLVYIEALAVAAVERGHGIGSLLLQDAAEWALQHRRDRLALHVVTSNCGARRLYERLGFRQWHLPGHSRISRWTPAAVHRNGWTALLMQRRLESKQ